MASQVSAIVVSFNTAPLLERAILSLQRSASLVQGVEIIVVDNASDDGSAQMVRNRFPGVRLVQLTRNVGFAAGTNVGLRMARAEQLLLFNPDAELIHNALPTLSSFLVERPWLAAVGPRLIYPDGSQQDSAFRFPSLGQIFLDYFPIHRRLLQSRLNGRYATTDAPLPIDHPLGACMLISRAALEDVGLLDEGFFMYCEEVDWCMRARLRGWEIYHHPGAVVVHHGGKSTEQRGGAMYQQLHASRARFYEKHYGRSFRTLARVISQTGLRREIAHVKRLAKQGALAPERARERIRACRSLLAHG
ncbi:MAG: glycosyltransferase family 2 protein [Chloroflexota bacterium]